MMVPSRTQSLLWEWVSNSLLCALEMAHIDTEIACRLPGDVDSPSSLWKLLEEERSGQCDVPESRFNIDAFYEPGSSEVPGGMNMKGGYFIKEDIREFDNEFFGILNAEATYMDPQQRKLLEVVFESFESAGISLDQVSGSDTGCYVCNFSSDYIVMQTKDPEYMDRYSATGMGATILGNRISHTFNMLGPSQVIDTACSSSLYCLNSACAALESRDCNAAVVAGANLIQSIEQHLGMMKAGVLSPTSTCHTFSDEVSMHSMMFCRFALEFDSKRRLPRARSPSAGSRFRACANE